ncbi:unnamed protein product [Ectocarpus sp. 12 AP-2014]
MTGGDHEVRACVCFCFLCFFRAGVACFLLSNSLAIMACPRMIRGGGEKGAPTPWRQVLLLLDISQLIGHRGPTYRTTRTSAFLVHFFSASGCRCGVTILACVCLLKTSSLSLSFSDYRCSWYIPPATKLAIHHNLCASHARQGCCSAWVARLRHRFRYTHDARIVAENHSCRRLC